MTVRVSQQVTASNRDATQATDTSNGALTGTALIGHSSIKWWGIAVTGVVVPAGTTNVTAAYLTLNLNNTKGYAPSATVYGEKVLSASAYTTAVSNISNRTRTTASVLWSTAYASNFLVTINVTTLVQEIVAQASWPGTSSPMSFIFVHDSSSSVSVDSWDGSSTTAARLTIWHNGTGTDQITSVSGVGQTTSIGSPGVSGNASITVTGVGQTTSIGSPGVTAAYSVAIAGIGQATSVGAPTTSTAITRSVTGFGQTTSVGSPVIGSSFAATVTGVGQSTSVGVPSITRAYSVTVAGIGQATSVGNVTGVASINVTVTGIAIVVGIGTPNLNVNMPPVQAAYVSVRRTEPSLTARREAMATLRLENDIIGAHE